MPTSKPSESILLLFDPLANLATPPRNTNSPDSTSSDKENDAASQQPGQLTLFFNRIYKEHPVSDSGSPNGRLIDFGDASFTSHCGDEENVEEETVDENADAELSCSVRRRPLADLEVERVASPPSPSHKRRLPHALPRVSWTENVSLSPFVAPPSPSSGPTLADVINEINLSAMTISNQQEVREEHGELGCPNITVCPPDFKPAPSSPQVEDSADQPLSSSHLSPVASIPGSSTTRRMHTPNNTSAYDPRRTSVDLQSIFSLQMQSSEMSFDLLNDKISFLNTSTPNRSLADADAENDTFDLAKEQLKMEEIASRYMQPSSINIEEDTFDFVKEQRRMEAGFQKYEPIREESLAEIALEMPRVKELTPPKPAPSIERTLESAVKPDLRPPVFSLPPASVSKSSDETNQVNKAPAVPTSPTISSSKTAPALPLAKKTFKMQHDRLSSASSSIALGSSMNATRRTSISQPRPSLTTSSTADAPHPPVPSLKPPARRLSNATSTVRPTLRAPAKPTPTAVASNATAPSKLAGTFKTLLAESSASGPKRPASSSDPTAPTRPAVASKGSIPPPASRLYRPVLPSASRREAVTPSTTQAKTGLRQPTASASNATPMTSGTKSALPRPASRLPAPSKLSSGVARRL